MSILFWSAVVIASIAVIWLIVVLAVLRNLRRGDKKGWHP
jgi:hypothetical protein